MFCLGQAQQLKYRSCKCEIACKSVAAYGAGVLMIAAGSGRVMAKAAMLAKSQQLAYRRYGCCYRAVVLEWDS